METKEAVLLSAFVIFVCFTVSARADAEDDIAYQSGGGDTTEFGQAKAVRCVINMVWRKEVKSHVNTERESTSIFRYDTFIYLKVSYGDQNCQPEMPTKLIIKRYTNKC